MRSLWNGATLVVWEAGRMRKREYRSFRGDIWGGADGYLNRYIRLKDSVVTYRSDDNDPDALKGQGVYSIIEDSDGRLWLGNYRGWINAEDIELKNYTCHPHIKGEVAV